MPKNPRLYQGLFAVILLVFSFGWAGVAMAQDGGQGRELNQVSLLFGKVLPNGVEGAPEIFSLSGLRYSRRFAADSQGFWELGGVGGNSEGVSWTGAFASLRMDVPIETLIGIAYLGLDFSRYEGISGGTVQKGGGHVGGGLMSLIGGNAYFRFDMKLNSKPGTSLFFSLGLTVVF